MAFPLVSRIGRAFAEMRKRMVWPGVGGSGSYGLYHGGYGWVGTLPGTNVNVAREVGDPALNGAVSICLNWIADQFPEPEFRVCRKKRDGTDQPIPRHPLPLLIDSPNPYYDGDALWAATIVSYCVSGDAYWYKVKDNVGRVKELWHLPYWQVRPRWPADGSQFISWYDYYVDGKPMAIRPQDLVHFRFSINLATRRGVSRLAPVLRSVLADNEGDTYAYAILKNMGIPGCIISPGKAAANAPTVYMDEPTREEVKRLYRENVTGDNRGTPLVFGDAVEVTPVGMSPKDIDLGTIRDRPEDRICAALRLPAMVVGLTSGAAHKTYANYEEAYKHAYTDCIIPMQKRMCGTLRRDADLVRPGEYPGWDYTKVEALREDQDNLHARMREDYQKGLLTRNEARAELGYPPVVEEPIEGEDDGLGEDGGGEDEQDA